MFKFRNFINLIILSNLFIFNKSWAFNFLFKNETKILSKNLSIDKSSTTLNINPGLKAKNTTQYINLYVKDAKSLKKNEKTNELISSDGQKIEIYITIENEFGKTYRLTSIGFGKALMFSFCCSKKLEPSDSDLPKSEKFTKLIISASKKLDVEKIEWRDITNK